MIDGHKQHSTTTTTSTHLWPLSVVSRKPFTFHMYMVPSAEPQAIFEAPQLKDARAKSQLILKCSWLQGIENGFYESQLHHAESPGGLNLREGGYNLILS